VLYERFKRAEHGGFAEDDTHVTLMVSGGGVDGALRGTTVDDPVQTTQCKVKREKDSS
jgi:hypothetical protein